MQVLTDAGRTADLTDYEPTDTVGEVADAIAANTHNGGKPIEGALFSFKVDGVVTHPDTLTADIELNDASVLELVDVTEHDWSKVGDAIEEPLTGVEVPLGQTGTLEPVPDGTVDELITWVGDDTPRARLVLAVENERDHPRSTLVDALEGLLAE